MNPRFILGQLMFCLLVVGSCKKPSLPQQPEEQKQMLVIALSKPYMPGDKIDSAFAVWDANGGQQTVRLSSKNDTLFADVNQFQEGGGTLTVQVFSSIKFGGQYSSQWICRQQMSVQHSKAIELTGATGFGDPKWLPRVVLKDAIGHTAIVALRPEDAYFSVKNVPPGLREIVVARDYWKNTGGISRAGGGEWHCTQNCTNASGDAENTQFFTNLPGQIGTKPWNHIEITILYVEDQWGGGSVLSLAHTLQ